MTREHEPGERATGEGMAPTRKAGMAAVGGLSLGSATMSAAAQDDDDQGLIYANSFIPNTDFEVIARLEQSTTVRALQVDGELPPEISEPDDYTGHVIRYDLNGDIGGITTFMFMLGAGWSTEETGTTDEDASMFSPQLNLVETEID